MADTPWKEGDSPLRRVRSGQPAAALSYPAQLYGAPWVRVHQSQDQVLAGRRQLLHVGIGGSREWQVGNGASGGASQTYPSPSTWRVVADAWAELGPGAALELRVRDVGTRHTPLIGLPGRIGVFPDQGSHPGPLSFYLVAPVYRLLGASAWAMLVGMIVLALVAIGVALWIAQRRGGAPLVVAVAGLVALVVRGYGLDVVTQPWNPYLPLLFWLVVLLGTWSVLAGDHLMVVVVAAAGSLAGQTHLPYLGLSLGMGGLCVVALAHAWWRHPSRRNEVVRAAGRIEPDERRIYAPDPNPPKKHLGHGTGLSTVVRVDV